jgi:TPR repeat protein
MIGSLFIFGFGLMTSLGINLSEGFGEMAFSESATAGSNEDPKDAFYGFSQAMEQGDYPVAFSHLTPESQVAMIAMPVLAVSLEQAFSGKSGTKSPNMVKLESVFAKQGVSIKPEDIGENSFNSVADKGQLFQELVDAVPSLFDDIDEDMPSGALVAVTITGNTAKGVVDGEDIHFKQIGGSWLVDLAAMDEDEGFTIEMGQMDFGDSFSRPRRSSKATPTEVESKVVQFHTAKAHAGNMTSQYELGMRYQRGDGVEQNDEHAADWLSRSADQGHTRAKKELASLQAQLKLQAETESRMKARLSGSVTPGVQESGFTPGKPAVAAARILDLDGVNSFVELPPGIFADLNEATIECWVKWDGFQNGSRAFDIVVGKRLVNVMNRGSSPNLWAEMFVNGNRVHVEADGVLRLNRWTHVAVTTGNRGISLYVDGRLYPQRPVVVRDTFRSTEFGRRNFLGRSNARNIWPNDQDLDGQLNDVRVWNRIRTPDEIKAGMNSRITGTEPGLVGFWNFDDQANPGRDLSSGNHHGQLKGSASVTSGSHLQQL